MRHIYVSGPMGNDAHTGLRCHEGMDAGQVLIEAGFFPFVPHVFHHWPFENSYERWMEFDLAWVRRCDGLIRLPGDSPGGDREVALARELGLLIWFGTAETFIDAYGHLAKE
jgi:hypothetical protein